MSLVSQALKTWLVENDFAVSSLTNDEAWKAATQTALDSEKLTSTKFAELQENKVKAADVFGGARVKRPSERYTHTKSVAKHSRTGQPVRDERGAEVQSVTQLEHAKAGAFLKRIAQRSGLPVEISEHESELIAECFEQDTWCGKIGGEYKTGIDGMRVKALLDDATSGGAEVVPEWFDAAVIQFPLLHSELLPRVDLVSVPRGSTVETASIGNPTVQWNIADGTAMTPFTTTALVAGIDTNIHPVTCAIEIGRDFLSDAAVDVGRVLTENVGQRLLAELDKVITIGDGTTQPEGLFTASGTTDIGTPSGGAGAAPQINDFEALLFGLPKEYRRPEFRTAFLANDISYKRARSIPVGGSDARRVFGMDHSSYTLLENPFVINNDLVNTKAAFVALAKYRLYRRAAQEIRFETGGRELSLKNLALLIVRGRFGGKLMDADAFAFSDNWQA
jgi:HK97 family phage major capsid protein